MANQKHYRTIGLSIPVVLLLTLAVSLVGAQPRLQSGEATAHLEPTLDATGTALSITATRTADEALATQFAQLSPVQPILTMTHEASVEGAQFWIAGARHVSWDTEGGIRLWDAVSGELLMTLDHGHPLRGTTLGVPLTSVQINADGTRLLAWNNTSTGCQCDLTATVWDIDSASASYGQRLVSVTQDDPNDVVPGGGAKWSPDERLLITWSRDGTARLWDADTGEELAVLRHSSVIWGAAWSRDSARLITWSSDRSARVWDVERARSGSSAEPDFELPHRRPPVWGALWSPDERMILTWSLEQEANLWDAVTGALVATLPHDGRIWSASWEGDRIITAAFDSAVRVWDVRDVLQRDSGEGWQPALMLRQNAAFTRTIPRPDGRVAVSTGSGRLIGWSLETGGIYYNLPVRADSMAWFPGDGRYLLTVSDTGIAEVWGGTSGERIATLVQNTPIRGAAWGPDGVGGPQLFTWNEGGQVTAWSGRLAQPQVIAQPPTAVTPTATVTQTPTFTPTASSTPTPIPPPATAAVEAAWYRSNIFANRNPRTAWLLQVPVGGSLDLLFGAEECCYVIEEDDWPTLVWSVEPSDQAAIDAETGLLTVGEDAEGGPLTVTVSTAGGLSKSAVVHVYDPEANPLVGIWVEDARVDCETGTFVPPDTKIHEFILTADGRMSVSWFEFEVYVDYVGAYRFDLESGALRLQGQYLNYFPSDFDGDGSFSLDDQGSLILHDIWLGTGPFPEPSSGCGHRFVRR